MWVQLRTEWLFRILINCSGRGCGWLLQRFGHIMDFESTGRKECRSLKGMISRSVEEIYIP